MWPGLHTALRLLGFCNHEKKNEDVMSEVNNSQPFYRKTAPYLVLKFSDVDFFPNSLFFKGCRN